MLYDVTNVRFGNGVTVALGTMGGAAAPLFTDKDAGPQFLPDEPSWLARLHEPLGHVALDDGGLIFRPADPGDWS